jgi:hypothetical protein
MKNKILFILLASTLLLKYVVCIASFPADSLFDAHKIMKPNGYKAIVAFDDGFVAAGSEGRIDWFTKSGSSTKYETLQGEEFNALLLLDSTVVVAGNHGSMLFSSSKGPFRKIDCGTSTNINSLTLLGNKIIAGADNGEIVVGYGNGLFQKIKLAVRGNIVSVSALFSDCYGVTSEGEIIHSKNGIDWNIQDFNQTYSGYYKPCSFTKVVVTDNRIAIAGVNNDGMSVLFFSNQGNVWTERTLNYIDEQGAPAVLESIPYDVFYNSQIDEFILACSKGILMTIPACSHCNKAYQITTSSLTSIYSNENTLMVVGESFFAKVLSE